MGAVATRASSDVASGAALASAGDPSSSRIVYGIVVALLVIGVALVAVAVWVFRQTRVDPEVLAPLETMSDRRWRRLDPASQRRMLDEERPEGAEPLRPATSVPVPDEEFAAGTRPVDGFDDLKADPDDAAAAGDEAEVPDERVGAEGVAPRAGGGEPEADRDASASVDASSVQADAADVDGSGEVSTGDAEAVGVDEPGEPVPDGDGSGEVSAGDGEVVGVDESGEPVAAADGPVVEVSDEPTPVADESAEGLAPRHGSAGLVEGSVAGESQTHGSDVDDTAAPDGSDADVALAPDPAVAARTGSVDRTGDETPPIGGEAPLPEDVDPTDEPARTDG